MRDERREQILSCAVRLFATRGLAATKISDIAAAAGVAHGLLYHYFDSKESMFVEIVRRAFARMNAAALALERMPISPREKLESAAAQILGGLERSDDFAWYSTLISQARVSEAVPKEAKAIIRREADIPYEVVSRIVRAGQKSGEVVKLDPDQLTLAFWTCIKGLAMHKAALGDAFKSPDPRVLTGIFFRKATP